MSVPFPTQDSDSPHVSVLLDEVLTGLAPRDGGIYVDGTFGAGGYSLAVLGRAACTVYGIDRDPNAAAAGRAGVRLAPGEPQQIRAADQHQRVAQRVEPGHRPGQQGGNDGHLQAAADADAEHVRQGAAQSEVDAAGGQHQVVGAGRHRHRGDVTQERNIDHLSLLAFSSAHFRAGYG